MESVSSRHSGDLGGKLGSIHEAHTISVSVEIPAAVAADGATQHTAWMLINMLARLERVVARLSIKCPEDVPVSVRLTPLAAESTVLRDALSAASAAVEIATVPIDFSGEALDCRLVVGPGDPQPDGLRVYGEGWCGGFARGMPIAAASSHSNLPFGPYIAAALAVGEVFKVVRIDPKRFPPTDSAFYSLWTHEVLTSVDDKGPAEVADLTLRETLVGVGAVGCICAQALWATDGIRGEILLVDGDPDGIDLTNLNRYLLFGPAHVGLPKASTAANLLQRSTIQWRPHDGVLETAEELHRNLLCAVDTNRSRHGVQIRWPDSLLMASTYELRAEVVRCDPRWGGPCASCYNEPKTDRPDDEMRQLFLRASLEDQAQMAASVGTTVEQADAWARLGECGTSGERVREALLGEHSEIEAFAVPSVSCAAGTMLAAEALKEELDAPTPLSPSSPRASIQFWRPERSQGAGPYRRDPKCRTCQPGTDAAQIWSQRMAQRPLRSDAASKSVTLTSE